MPGSSGCWRWRWLRGVGLAGTARRRESREMVGKVIKTLDKFLITGGN